MALQSSSCSDGIGGPGSHCDSPGRGDKARNGQREQSWKAGWPVERIRRQKSQDLATGCWEGGGGRGGAESDSEFSTRVTKNMAGP